MSDDQQISFEELAFNEAELNNPPPAKPVEKPKAKPKATKEEKDVAEDKKKGSLPNWICGYSRFEVVSSFHKELRLGNEEKATYWLQVMITGGVGAWYPANYLWWISAEELAMEEVHGDFGQYLGLLNQLGTKADPYQLYYAVMRFCKAKKWWEDPESCRMRDLWGKNQRALKDGEKLFDIPLYAHDRHTSKGKALMKTGEADLRYSGMWNGMKWRQKAFEQHGTIDVEWDDVKWEDGEYDYWDKMERDGL